MIALLGIINITASVTTRSLRSYEKATVIKVNHFHTISLHQRVYSLITPNGGSQCFIGTFDREDF